MRRPADSEFTKVPRGGAEDRIEGRVREDPLLEKTVCD
jgi:hypothetical protein